MQMPVVVGPSFKGSAWLCLFPFCFQNVFKKQPPNSVAASLEMCSWGQTGRRIVLLRAESAQRQLRGEKDPTAHSTTCSPPTLFSRRRRRYPLRKEGDPQTTRSCSKTSPDSQQQSTDLPPLLLAWFLICVSHRNRELPAATPWLRIDPSARLNLLVSGCPRMCYGYMTEPKLCLHMHHYEIRECV